MLTSDLRLCKDLCNRGRSFFSRGLSGGASGNMSVRLRAGFAVTPTGCSLGELTPNKLCILDASGVVLGDVLPTKEIFVHLACYKAHTDCGAVVHLHTPYSVAWSCLSGLDPTDAVPSYTPYGLMRYGRVALVPYHKPGSPELTQQIQNCMPMHKAVLLAHHGAIMTGSSLIQAADNMEELEASCRLALQLYGKPAQLLTTVEQQALLIT